MTTQIREATEAEVLRRRVRYERMRRGWNYLTMAEKLSRYGKRVTFTEVFFMEKGDRPITTDELTQLSRILQLTINQLLDPSWKEDLTKPIRQLDMQQIDIIAHGLFDNNAWPGDTWEEDGHSWLARAEDMQDTILEVIDDWVAKNMGSTTAA